MSYRPVFEKDSEWRLLLNGLELVILDCPYDTIGAPETQRLFSKICALKIQAYGKAYSPGVLPLDTSDFIATHLLLCQKTPQGPEPLLGMKCLTLQRCQFFGLPFPAHGLLKDNALPDHQRALDHWLQEGLKNQRNPAYNGGWTMNEAARSHPLLKQICYDVTVLFFSRFYGEGPVSPVIAGATLRFKIETFKEFMGFHYLNLDGKKLPPFDCKPFRGEKVALMVLDQPSPEAKRLVALYDGLWSGRKVIAGPPGQALSEKGAA